MRAFLIVVLLCLTASTTFGQDIKQFEEEFKAAVKKKKKEKVASFFADPFFSMDWAYTIPVENEDDRTGDITNVMIVENYKLLFTKEAVKAIMESPMIDGTDLYSEGTWTLRFMKTETAAAWFVITVVDGEYKITGTDNVSE